LPVTIDISSTEIRLLETDGEKVTKWASRSLEPGIFEEDVLSDPVALSVAIKRLVASSGIGVRNMTAGVAGLYSITRIVLLSTPPGETITEESVLEAAADVMPVSEEETYLSWRNVGAAEGGQQVMVIGIPRDVIDSEMQVLKAAGLNPRVLELKSIALARAVGREQALILNIEPSSFDIVIVADGITEVTRTTAWKSSEFSLEDKAEQLAIALELTIGYYNSHHTDFPLDRATPFFVTGQMSGDIALMENLQERVGRPSEPLVPPIECPSHLPVSQYAVNIGLALRGMVATRNPHERGYSFPDINLLPSTYKPWRPSTRQIYLFLAVIAAVILLFPLYQVTTDAMGKASILKTTYEAMTAELERRQVELRKRQPLHSAISRFNAIVNMGGGITEDIEVVNTIANELGVKVQSITHEGNRVLINCEAGSSTTFRNFLTALEENGLVPIPPPEGFPYRTGGSIELRPRPAE